MRFDLYWFTSDWHCFHTRVIRYDNRPFKNLDEMHESLIANHNVRVSPSDTVFMVGDFTCGGNPEKAAKILKQLNGKIHLIKGNHDLKSKTALLNRVGFESVKYRDVVNISGVNLYLSHYPFFEMYQDSENIDEYHRRRMQTLHDKKPHVFWPYNEVDGILVHGHTHDSYRLRTCREKVMINVNVTAWDYRPVQFDEIFSLYKSSKG